MSQQRSLYDAVGGDEGVRQLVDTFYDIMDELPEAQAIRAMHPTDLTESRAKLYEFLSGWMGGPPLYVIRRGHPRLRARHLPFPIDTSAAAAWLRCMQMSLDRHLDDPGLIEQLTQAFAHIAAHMRNKPDEDAPPDAGE